MLLKVIIVLLLSIIFVFKIFQLESYKHFTNMEQNNVVYSHPNQPLRFANQKESNDLRALDIDQFYKPELIKGKIVLVTGSNRGIGLALVKQLVLDGAKVIASYRSEAPTVEGLWKTIGDVDVTSTEKCEKMADALKEQGIKVDILINNAGYFMEPIETIESCDFDEQMKMINICSVGMLRISSAVVKRGLLTENAKISMITSQGGSIAWRETQNAGDNMDYGHHMSKAAANMAGKLLAIEMKRRGVSVSILHPGFNKTDMTKKYSHIWEIEGAVDPMVGAKRVLHEINIQNLETAGTFINCEDGLPIPW